MDRKSQAIRILIADDHPIFRHGLRKLLEADPGFKVIGEAADGEQAVSMVRQLTPDILLLDLAMPHIPGLEVIEALQPPVSNVRIILLTAAIEREQTIRALHQGVCGIVLKECATEMLLKSVRCVMAGQYWIGRESVSDLIKALREPSLPGTRPRKNNYSLTPREMDIVSAIVSGCTNKDIAEKFSISEQTVKHHLGNVFDKLGVSTRLELAVFAVNHHLVDNN